MTRVFIVAIIALAFGCPASRSQTGPDHPGSHSGQKIDQSETGNTGAAPSGNPGRQPGKGTGPANALASTGIACTVQPCIYHAGADAYFSCTNSGNGTCFHYGRACEPTHGCMYDASHTRYRSCARAANGKCLQFGAPCEPPGACMYNPADQRHYVCKEEADGSCRRYGALCDPL